MFAHNAQTVSDFNRLGNLKSLITWSFCGNVSAISIRKRARYKQDEETEAKQEFYLVIEDSYGWQCSYFRQGMTLEKAQEISRKIPYGRTVFIEGEIAIRKGNTYFNAIHFKNPDQSNLLLIPLEEEEDDLERPDEE